MKNIIYIITVIAAALAGWVLVRARSQSNRASIGESEASKDVYLGLRNQALHMSRQNIGIPTGSSPTQPWGVIIDWGVSNGTATIVAFADGSASIYLSSGGGYIGGESHKSINDAAKKTVTAGAELQPAMRPTSDYPLPKQGEAMFYLLTDQGVFTDHALESDLRKGVPLSGLFGAGQEVVTQYRLLQDHR